MTISERGGEPPPGPVRLSQLAAAAPGGILTGDAWVWDVAYDSRRVRPGSLFFAMTGSHADGHEYAPTAVAAGASALVVERLLALPVPQLLVTSVREAVGPVSGAYYGNPSRRMRVVGVTGTNGKTTVCSVLRQCLDAAGLPAGQIGTVGSHFCGRSLPADLTTPQATDLQWTLWQMARSGVGAVAMEASSHGLDQHRLDGISFDVGIFTNLSREHLDYHGTMERYLDAKTLLFDEDRCGEALIGIDDEWGRKLLTRVRIPVVTYGSHDAADVRIEVREHGLEGICVSLAGVDGGVEIPSPLVGAVNGPNVAAAYLAARRLGVPQDTAVRGIAAAAPPPGRFELVDAGQPFLVVVDYAHTQDALSALIGTARRLTTGKVTVVLGARGNRDRGKRTGIGREASQADRVVLTADSPGDEPVSDIIQAIYRGVLEGRGCGSVFVEPDRRRAIELAVTTSEPGDVVLIVGRGHEQVQHFGARAVFLDDRDAARDALALILGSSTGERAVSDGGARCA